MSDPSAGVGSFRALKAREGRKASTARNLLKVRPVLESLESIELLSSIHAHLHPAPATAGKSVGLQVVLPLNYGITGIRQDVGSNVVITGGTGPPSLTDGTPAFIYDGPLSALSSSSSTSYVHVFAPKTIAGQSVASLQFYGPNTSLFDPRIGAGNITAVGAYRYTSSSGSLSAFQLGVIYKGPLDGSGTYTSIAAPGNGKEAVGDTVPHSTMGNLVVGNFDYQRAQERGHGFIYDKANHTWTTVDVGRFSTTIYGVWQNGSPSSVQYTIVGGYSDGAHGAKAFIENYNAATHRFSNFASYSFANVPSVVTHFEGISAVPGGFSIAATELGKGGLGASYAYIPVLRNGSFGTARWVAIRNTVNPPAGPTGDTVIDTSVMGIIPYNGGASSYIASITKP